MRTGLIGMLSVAALLLTGSAASAVSVEYVCKENKHDKNPLHMVLDEDWGTITLDGDERPAQFSETRVIWEEAPRSGPDGSGGSYYEVRTRGTLDRKTGVLKAHADPVVSPRRRVPRSGGYFTVKCDKADKPS